MIYKTLHRKQKNETHGPPPPSKSGVNSGVPDGVDSSCSTSGTRHVTLVTNPVISQEC